MCRHSIHLRVYEDKVHEYLPDVSTDVGGVSSMLPTEVTHCHPMFNNTLERVTLPVYICLENLII